MPTASSLACELLSEKSGRNGGYSRLRSVALTYDWSWWYPSGNRPLQQYLGFTAGAGYGQFEHKADSGLQIPKKRAELIEEIDVWAESPRLSPYGLSCIIVTMWAVNHYRDNAALPTKPSATKMPNWSWRTRQLLTCRCVSVMLLRSMQNTRRS